MSLFVLFWFVHRIIVLWRSHSTNIIKERLYTVFSTKQIETYYILLYFSPGNNVHTRSSININVTDFSIVDAWVVEAGMEGAHGSKLGLRWTICQELEHPYLKMYRKMTGTLKKHPSKCLFQSLLTRSILKHRAVLDA